MGKITVCSNLRDTCRLARAFVAALKRRGGAVVLFDAPMGAGKTTFIRECVKALGARMAATSPTFSIINNYGENLYHIDLYRVESAAELENIGFYEIVSGAGFVFIEWAWKFSIEYPADAVRVKIDVKGDDSRVFDITC